MTSLLLIAVALALSFVVYTAWRRRSPSSGAPSPSAVLSKHPSAVSRFSGGEMVISLPGQAEGLALNAVAARCWEEIDGTRNVSAIAHVLASDYGVSRAAALREIQSLGRQVKKALLALEAEEWELVHFHFHDLFAGSVVPEHETGLLERRFGEALVLHAAVCLAAEDGSIEPWRGTRRQRRAARAAMKAHRASEAPLEDAVRRFQQGWDACTAGNIAEAESAFRSCAEAAPRWANAHYQLGYVLLRMRRYDDAIVRLTEADTLSPGLYMVREYMDQAKRLSAGSLSYEAFLLFDRANAYGLQDPEATIRLARKALELAPGYAPAHLLLGRAYQRKGQLDDALSELGRALRLQPDQATLCQALLSRGAVFMAQGRTEEALREWEKVIEINGSASATRTALATMASTSPAH